MSMGGGTPLKVSEVAGLIDQIEAGSSVEAPFSIESVLWGDSTDMPNNGVVSVYDMSNKITINYSNVDRGHEVFLWIAQYIGSTQEFRRIESNKLRNSNGSVVFTVTDLANEELDNYFIIGFFYKKFISYQHSEITSGILWCTNLTLE